MEFLKKHKSILFVIFALILFSIYILGDGNMLALIGAAYFAITFLRERITILDRKINPFLETAYLLEVAENGDGKYQRAIEKVVKAGEGLELHKKQNKRVKDETKKDAYEKLYKAIEANTYTFNNLVAKHDSISSNEAAKLAADIAGLTEKLSVLDNLFIELEANTKFDHKEESKQIDELISSLREMA